jgi:hypothetical protein
MQTLFFPLLLLSSAVAFEEASVYGETADNILESLIDFYLENKNKPGVKDRKIKRKD